MADEMWMTSVEAAGYSGLSTSHLARLCRDGQITCRKFGRDWQISRASVKAYMERWYPDWREPDETKR